MTRYEALQAEYDEELIIEEHEMITPGLYSDGIIWIKKDLTEKEKICILAEEIGHHETSYGNILDLNDINNAKQEHTARRWAFEKLVPIDAILSAVQAGHTELWDIAEHLSVSEKFLLGALIHYGIITM